MPELRGRSADPPKRMPNWAIAACIVVPVVAAVAWFVTHSGAFS